MSAIFIIRHTEPAASWQDAEDPGLSEKGHTQARETAERLAEQTDAAMPLFSSPMRRAQETAHPLAGLWRGKPEILPAFTEIPSPDFPAGRFVERGAWIQSFMVGRWDEALREAGGEKLALWRESLLSAFAELAARHGGGVVFSHFVAINALLAEANGGQEVIQARPAHGSIWRFAASESKPRLLEAGIEVESVVR